MRILVASLLSLILQSFLVMERGRFGDLQALTLFLVSIYIVLEAVWMVGRRADRGNTGEAVPLTDGAAHEEPTTAAPVPLESIVSAEMTNLLSQLQQRGRLIDFLMDDIAGYSDAQVGAAARVVHEGCRAFLRESFDIQPIENSTEGKTVTVGEGFNPTRYRFVGKVHGKPPYTGTLLHRGWRVAGTQLPYLANYTPTTVAQLTIAPAEVELR